MSGQTGVDYQFARLLFVSQGFDGVQAGGGSSRVDAEDDSDAYRDAEGDRQAGRDDLRIHVGEHRTEL